MYTTQIPWSLIYHTDTMVINLSLSQLRCWLFVEVMEIRFENLIIRTLKVN